MVEGTSLMENTSSMDLAWGDGSSSNGSLRECWRATHACRVAQFLTGCGQVPVCVQGLGTLDLFALSPKHTACANAAIRRETNTDADVLGSAALLPPF